MVRVGGLISNHNGDCIARYGKNIGVCSNNNTKAMDAWGGIKLLKILRFQIFILEGDSKVIADILKGESVVPWELRDILDN